VSQPPNEPSAAEPKIFDPRAFDPIASPEPYPFAPAAHHDPAAVADSAAVAGPSAVAYPEAPWYMGPAYPAEPPKPPRRPGLTAVQALGVLIAVSALGWPLGVLWQAVAPNIPVLVVADGAIYDDTQPEQFMGGDGWFVVLGLLFGVAVAAVTWMACKHLRGPLGLLVLAVGASVAGVLAWKVGRDIGLTEYLDGLHSAPEGTHLSKPNDLRIESFQWWPPKLAGVLLIPAFGSALAMTIMAAWSSLADLRTHPEPPPPMTDPEPPAPQEPEEPRIS